MKKYRNPYDAKQGGTKALLKKVYITIPNKNSPYQGTKVIVKYE